MSDCSRFTFGAYQCLNVGVLAARSTQGFISVPGPGFARRARARLRQGFCLQRSNGRASIEERPFHSAARRLPDNRSSHKFSPFSVPAGHSSCRTSRYKL
ncbi:hypothetical protein NDU88_012379 [Pleurodeles waltl]|uniref:Uncharacterized protein n=1 Tax=Pleurodeles waltl TaxID=8319 RepID=A0AAV7QZY7_PLEWA|nr:hypothetical protein NDU88_012379 [Pleurodeles waltl]